MDYTRTENEEITLAHFMWLGFKLEKGALVKDGFVGEVQYAKGNFWYTRNRVATKKIVINKDINDIYFGQKSNAQKPLPYALAVADDNFKAWNDELIALSGLEGITINADHSQRIAQYFLDKKTPEAALAEYTEFLVWPVSDGAGAEIPDTRKTKAEVAAMGMGGIVDYLMVNWTDLAKHMPDDDEASRSIFSEQSEDFLRGVALTLCSDSE